jgi:hypothetical protein
VSSGKDPKYIVYDDGMNDNVLIFASHIEHAKMAEMLPLKAMSPLAANPTRKPRSAALFRTCPHILALKRGGFLQLACTKT